MKRRKRYSVWLWILYFFYLQALSVSVWSATDEKPMVIYLNDPENTLDFQILKRQFDSYLVKRGPYSLQPVKEESIFNLTIRREEDAVFYYVGVVL